MQFAPSVYEHAARLIGRTPWEVSRDARLLHDGHAEAFRLYRHSPVVVGVDIYNLEAEAYGATVAEPEGSGIPAVTKHPFSSAAELAELPPFDPESAGRIPMVIETARGLSDELPGADVRVPVSGPFSIATSLVGFETLLMTVITEPGLARAALERLAANQRGLCEAVARAGIDVAFFESAAAPPLISPTMFREVELPALKLAMAAAAEAVGHAVPCVIGGDTAPVLDAMLETGTGYVIAPCETDQQVFMDTMAARPDVMVRVNTRSDVVARGDMPAVHAELDRIIDLCRARENSCIGTGALPYETDPEVVLAMAEYVAEHGGGGGE